MQFKQQTNFACVSNIHVDQTFMNFNIHVKMRKRKEVGIQALFRENASYLKKNEIEFQQKNVINGASHHFEFFCQPFCLKFKKFKFVILTASFFWPSIS